MGKKYILTDEKFICRGKFLNRIQAVKDFDNVKKGELGGCIESEDNLSQEGNSWVYRNSEVYGNAKIYGNSKIYNSEIFGEARIYDNANIFDSKIYDKAQVFGEAAIINTVIYKNAKVFDKAEISDSKIYGRANIYNNAYIDNSIIYGDCHIYNNSKISNSIIYDNAKIYSDKCANITGIICLNANIIRENNVYAPKIKCHEKGRITFFKDINNDICINLKWFKGTIDEFKDTIYSLDLNKLTINKYLRLINEAKNHIGI